MCLCTYRVLLEVRYERDTAGGAASLSLKAFVLLVYGVVGDSGVLRWSASDCS